MKLRFDVDQAACFRAGINHPTSTAVLDLDPATLPEKERNLIADRLSGIDVCQLWRSSTGVEKLISDSGPTRIRADRPAYDALIAAIKQNESALQIHRLRTNQDPKFLYHRKRLRWFKDEHPEPEMHLWVEDAQADGTFVLYAVGVSHYDRVVDRGSLTLWKQSLDEDKFDMLQKAMPHFMNEGIDFMIFENSPNAATGRF